MVNTLTSDILTRHETRRQIYGIKWSTLNKGRYCIVWAKSLVDVMRIGGYWATLKSYILAAIAPIYFRFALEYGQKLSVFTHIKNVQIYEEKTQRETNNSKKWQFVISACLWYYQPKLFTRSKFVNKSYIMLYAIKNPIHPCNFFSRFSLPWSAEKWNLGKQGPKWCKIILTTKADKLVSCRFPPNSNKI